MENLVITFHIGILLLLNGGIAGFTSSARSICGVTWLETDGLFVKQLYFTLPESSYGNNVDCTWFIDSNSPNYRGVYIEVKDIQIEYQPNCSAGYLQGIDDKDDYNSSLGKWCGPDLPPPKYSSGRYMTIRFHSNGLKRRAGFELVYRAATQITTVNPHLTSTNVGLIAACVTIACIIIVALILIGMFLTKRTARRTQGAVRYATSSRTSEPSPQSCVYTIPDVIPPSMPIAPPSYEEVMNIDQRQKSDTRPPPYSSLGDVSYSQATE